MIVHDDRVKHRNKQVLANRQQRTWHGPHDNHATHTRWNVLKRAVRLQSLASMGAIDRRRHDVTAVSNAISEIKIIRQSAVMFSFYSA